MAEHCMNLKPWQVRALQAGASQLWVPIREFDPDGYDTVTDTGIARVPWNAAAVAECYRCPYPPGCVFVGRETFSADSDYVEPSADGTVAFAADRAVWTEGRYACQLHESFQPKWKPASTLPTNLSRFRLPVVSCRPVRVCEISEADARACGCAPQQLGGLEYGLAAAFQLKHRAYGSSFVNHWLSDHGSRCRWESAWAWRIEVSRG